MTHALIAIAMILAPDDTEQVWEVLRQVGTSVDAFAFESVETYERDGIAYRDSFSFTLKGLDRSNVRMYRDSGDGAGDVLVYDVRQDGRHSYHPDEFYGHPGSLKSVAIANQESTPDQYSGLMNRALWLMLPGGRPLYAHRDHGATLSRTTGPEGQTEWVVESKHRDLELRIALDPEHDWLPRRLDMGDEVHIRVTNYAMADGRWYVQAGESEEFSASGDPKPKVRFEVTSFSYNPPLDDAMFGPPAITEGVAVYDETTGKRTYKGGPEAGSRLAARYPPPPREQSESEVDPGDEVLVVDHEDRGWIWVLGLVASVTLLVVAGSKYLRARAPARD